MTAALGHAPPKATPHLDADLRAVFWLACLPMLAACFLPWVLLRPNRLAAGQYLHLGTAQLALGVLLALALPLASRFAPKLVPLVACAALALGFWWLGTQTGAALAGQGESARASASSGLWLWLLGAGVAVYGAGLVAQRLDGWQRGSWQRGGWQRGGWQRWLSWLWLPLLLAIVATGTLGHWSVMQEYAAQRSRFFQELLQHLKLVLSALGLSVLIGAPLAVWASRHARVAGVVLGLAGGIQTVPSLALLGLLIAPLAWLAAAVPALKDVGISGIGTAPALTAMTLYALLPVLRNGLVSLRGVPAGVLDAARGMGMTDNQRFWRVQLPLALPVWLSGVRQAAVMLVGVASVAQLIGAGGLGYFIFSGMQSGAADLILLGAIPAALLAIVVDTLLRGLETLLGRQLGTVNRA